MTRIDPPKNIETTDDWIEMMERQRDSSLEMIRRYEELLENKRKDYKNAVSMLVDLNLRKEKEET